MDKKTAIRAIMEHATEAICAVLSKPGNTVHPSDLNIAETITDALKKQGVSEAGIEAALKR